MKCMRAVIVMMVGLFLTSAQASATEIVGATPGNGGDTDVQTYHFDENSVDFQMTLPDGTPLTQAEVPYRYGTSFQIFNDNLDYIAQKNLQILGADLSGANWTDAAYPAQGAVAIDPVNGRFKFPMTVWEGAVWIDADTGNTARFAQVAINNNDQVFVVFRQPDTGPNRIYANWYLPDSGWQVAIPVDPDTSYNADSPQITVNDDGKALCAYVKDDATNTRIYASAYEPGTGWGFAGAIDTGVGNSPDNPQIKMNEFGTAVCVFEQFLTPYLRIYANRYSPVTGWYGAVTIDAGPIDDASSPQVAIAQYGNIFCVFQQLLGPDIRVYANDFSGRRGWYGAVTIDAGAGNDALTPQIAMNDSRNAICVFRQNDGTYDRIYANHYVPGAGWQGAVLIDAISVTANASTPQIAMNNNGQAACAFVLHDGLNRHVYVNVYDPGTGWQGASVIDQGPEYESLFPQIAMAESGETACVFFRNDSLRACYTNTYLPGIGWLGAVLVNKPLGQTNGNQIAMNDRGKIVAVGSEELTLVDHVFANMYHNEIANGTTRVNYHILSEPVLTSTPTLTPVITKNRIVVTNRRIEPLRGERLSLQLDLTQAGKTTMKIYNLQGRLVKTLINEYLAAGSHTFDWTAVNDGGNLIASGVYIIQIQAPGISETQKVVVIK